MGLDNFMILKSRKDPNFSLDFAYFRKFYEFDSYAGSLGKSRESSNGSPYYKILELSDLQKIYQMIHPVYKEIMKLPENIGYYDDNSYPEYFEDEFRSCPFQPYGAESAFIGRKIMKLHSTLETLIDVIEENNRYNEYEGEYWKEKYKDFYIEFISSF